MLRMKLLRGARLAALAAVISLTFGSLAWAHDNDDYYARHDEATEHGYQNGYRDGVEHGRYDQMRGYRYNFKSDQWEDADNGYEHWMGSRGRYKKAYREGYVSGYRQSFGGYGYRHDQDDDRYRWHDRDDWR